MNNFRPGIYIKHCKYLSAIEVRWNINTADMFFIASTKLFARTIHVFEHFRTVIDTSQKLGTSELFWSFDIVELNH